jgi:hypothetical protein
LASLLDALVGDGALLIRCLPAPARKEAAVSLRNLVVVL